MSHGIGKVYIYKPSEAMRQHGFFDEDGDSKLCGERVLITEIQSDGIVRGNFVNGQHNRGYFAPECLVIDRHFKYKKEYICKKPRNMPDEKDIKN